MTRTPNRLPLVLCAPAALALLAVLAVGAPACAAEAPAPAPVTKAEIAQVVADLAKFKAGADPTPVHNLYGLAQRLHGRPRLTAELERRLVGLLEGPADYEAKLQACQMLARIGTEACIPTLERMLGDPKTTHMACYALEPNPSPKALAALRRALAKAEGDAAICILGVLAHRRDAEAVPLVAKKVSGDSPLVAEAAMAALGRIGTSEAADLLAGFRKTVPEALRGAAADAYMACAERLAEAGQRDRAARMLEEVLADDLPIHYHRGAQRKGRFSRPRGHPRNRPDAPRRGHRPHPRPEGRGHRRAPRP